MMLTSLVTTLARSPNWRSRNDSIWLRAMRVMKVQFVTPTTRMITKREGRNLWYEEDPPDVPAHLISFSTTIS